MTVSNTTSSSWKLSRQGSRCSFHALLKTLSFLPFHIVSGLPNRKLIGGPCEVVQLGEMLRNTELDRHLPDCSGSGEHQVGDIKVFSMKGTYHFQFFPSAV